MDDRPSTMSGLVNIVIMLTIAIGLFSTNVFWHNVALAGAWFTSIVGQLMWIGMADAPPMVAMRKRLNNRPKWRVYINRLIDAPIIIGLAGLGHWVLFFLFSLQVLLSWSMEIKAAEENS